MKNMFRVLACIAAGAIATASYAEEAPLWKAASKSGSSRLLAYALTRDRLPSGAKPFLREFARSNGDLHREGQGPTILSSHLGIAPLIGYDANLNNGIPAESLDLGGMRFTIDEDSRAKAGVTFGGRASAARSWSLAPRLTGNVSGLMSYEYAPEHHLDKATAFGRGCVSWHQAPWRWVGGCGGGFLVQKTDVVREAFTSASVTQAITSPIGIHEAKAELRLGVREDYEKATGTLSVTSVIPRLGTIGTGVTLGQPVAGQNTTLWSLQAWVGHEVLDRDMRLTGRVSKSGGSNIFGTEREDHSYQVVLSSQIRDGLEGNIGVEHTRSTIDAFGSTSLILGFSMKGWSRD